MTRKKAVAVVVFIISVIFCIIVFLIVFTENANKNVYKSELEEKLYYANASYTNSFNGTLNQMMSVADTVAIQVGSVFKYSDYNREGTTTICLNLSASVKIKVNQEYNEVAGAELTV